MGSLSRWQASGRARRTYPTAVGLALARARARRTWASSAEIRTDALQSMERLVGLTERAPEVEDLARRHVYEAYKYQELLWRPDVLARIPVRDVDRALEQARSGRGVIISKLHQGQFGAHIRLMAENGLALTVVANPRLFPEQADTLRGALRRGLRDQIEHPAVTLVPAVQSYATLRSVLRAGGAVSMSCDLAGTTPVRFLGRTIYVPSGTARLAMETGAAVVPISAVRDGRLEHVQVQEPLLPEDHATWQHLLQAVLDRHAPSVLAWPEAVERPLTHYRDEPAPRAREGAGRPPA